MADGGAGALATLTNEELGSRLDDLFRLKATVEGRIVELLGEVGRREAFRDDGATSVESWTAERFSVSVPTARAFAHVAERAWDLPHLSGALSVGQISFDKLRALADVATPETDGALAGQAHRCSVRQLAELARSEREAAADRAWRDYENRSLRFNDTFRTMTVQLPSESYTEARVCLESAAKEIPSDGETPWDQRLCDAFLGMVRGSFGSGSSASRSTQEQEQDREQRRQPQQQGQRRHHAMVVAHVSLAALTDEESQLPVQLERGGLISADTVRRLACGGLVTIAVDDELGHAMYEGRARRDPNPAQRREIWRRDRCCRFPGCANATFADVHHVRPWKPDGTTDLDNLVLLCQHHHHLVHSRRWRMSGDANATLTFVGPSDRVMTSRPSPMWTAVTDPATDGAASPQRD